MRRQLHSTAAITATVLLLCAAVAAFLLIAVLPAPSLFSLHPISITEVRTGAQNLAKATMTVLLLGYAAGVVGWIATFALGSDGMHRLNSVLNGRGPE